MKRSALQRHTPLARKPMKQCYPVKRALDRQASEAWAKGARAKPCAVCGCRGLIEGHHLVPQQQLRKVASETGLDLERLRWDVRGRLPLCPRHHAAHHSGARRVPLSVVLAGAPKLMQFVRELDRAHGDDRQPVARFIERTYPTERTA